MGAVLYIPPDNPYGIALNRPKAKIAELALICIEKDAYAVAKAIHRFQIPTSLSCDDILAVGIACAQKNPSATLKFKEKFSKALHIHHMNFVDTNALEKIVNEANKQLALQNSSYTRHDVTDR